MKESIAKYITPVLASILAVFAPIKGMLIVTAILIACDLISGLLAAKKRGEKISSAGLRRTLTKILVYNMAILTGFLVQTYMVSDVLPITALIAGVISLVELKSILENLNSVNGTDIFRSLIEKLGSVNDVKESPTKVRPPKK